MENSKGEGRKGGRGDRRRAGKGEGRRGDEMEKMKRKIVKKKEGNKI